MTWIMPKPVLLQQDPAGSLDSVSSENRRRSFHLPVMSFRDASSTRSPRPMLSQVSTFQLIRQVPLCARRDSLQACVPERRPERIRHHTLDTSCLSCRVTLSGIGMLQPKGVQDTLCGERVLREVDIRDAKVESATHQQSDETIIRGHEAWEENPQSSDEIRMQGKRLVVVVDGLV